MSPKEKLTSTIAVSKEFEYTISDHLGLIAYLTKIHLTVDSKIAQPAIQLNGIRIALTLPEKTPSKKPQDSIAVQQYITALKKRLSDPVFLSKAPPHVIEKEQKRLKEIEENLISEN